jgi:hypothetical protein
MPMAKAAWDVADWLTRRTTPAGEGAAARRQGRAKRLAKLLAPARNTSEQGRPYNRLEPGSRPTARRWRMGAL